MADRRVLTTTGLLDVAVYATAEGYVAEHPDGVLTSFGATEDEAVARLIAAVERSAAPSAEHQ
jgi:hypothetical protein